MKTVFYSEDLKKTFETEEECAAAEKEHAEALALEKAKKEERATAAKEVEDAFKEAKEAYDKANEMLNEFVKKYGSFHYTYSSSVPRTHKSLLDYFFDDTFFLF